MRERRVGRGALLARIVAGAAGAAVLVTAAPPVYAQDDGGGEELCKIHDSRVAEATGIVEASDGDGWWVLPDGEGQTDEGILTVRKVGSDCNVRDTEAGSLGIAKPFGDPEDLAIEPDKGFLWIADIGDVDDRESIALTQVSVDDATNFTTTRYVYPDGMKDAEAYFLLPDRTPVFIPSTEGTAELYKSDGLGEEEDTPLELAGTVTLPDGAGAVTGAALNADATKVVLRTGDSAYEWDVADGDPVASMTSAEPRVTPLDDGGNDIAYDSEGNFLTIAQTDDESAPAAIYRFTPAAAAAEDEETAAEEEASGGGGEDSPSLTDRILALGFGTIVKILAAIAILGMATMVFGIVIIRKYRKQNGDGDKDDATEMGFAREESVFGDAAPMYDNDPVDLGLDSGQPDPDLGQVARGGVYGGARQEPSGNVYGAAAPAPRSESTGSVYGGAPARQEPSGNVYGASPARPEPPRQSTGSVYGGAREEPQYGAFEGGGNGSVYDNGGAGQSFAARPEPSGNVYGARPATPPAGQGAVYGGGGGPQGGVYGGGNNKGTPESEDDFWGPPEGGTTYGRGR